MNMMMFIRFDRMCERDRQMDRHNNSNNNDIIIVIFAA